MDSMYAELARDYHLLFPARKPQLDFLMELCGPPPARILDVASGTGEYTKALSDRGYDVTGIELDPAMCRSAIERHPDLAANGQLIKGDMLELEALVDGRFDLAFLIGNSLPHIASEDGVARVLDSMYRLTRPNGKVVVQVVNFDRVLAQAGADGCVKPGEPGCHLKFELPPLNVERDNGQPVILDRWYEIDATDTSGLTFRTRHTTLNGSLYGSTRLLCLTRVLLEGLLPAGAVTTWSGGFDRTPWTENSPATVLVLG